MKNENLSYLSPRTQRSNFYSNHRQNVINEKTNSVSSVVTKETILSVKKPRSAGLHNHLALNRTLLVRADFSSRQSDLILRSTAPRCGRYSISFFLYRSGEKEVIPRDTVPQLQPCDAGKKKRRPAVTAFLASPLDSPIYFSLFFSLSLIFTDRSYQYLLFVFMYIIAQRKRERETLK